MSLRATLRATVASCAPRQTQRATVEVSSATAGATVPQQPPVFPSVTCATSNATAAQLSSCVTPVSHWENKSCELRVPIDATRNKPTLRDSLSSLNTERSLKSSIPELTALRGYPESEAARLLAAVQALSPTVQVDLVDHFQAELSTWRRACGQPVPFSQPPQGISQEAHHAAS